MARDARVNVGEFAEATTRELSGALPAVCDFPISARDA